MLNIVIKHRNTSENTPQKPPLLYPDLLQKTFDISGVLLKAGYISAPGVAGAFDHDQLCISAGLRSGSIEQFAVIRLDEPVAGTVYEQNRISIIFEAFKCAGILHVNMVDDLAGKIDNGRKKGHVKITVTVVKDFVTACKAAISDDKVDLRFEAHY